MYRCRSSLLSGLLVSVVLLQTVASDLFSSSDHLGGMFVFEESLMRRMETFLDVSRKRLEVFTKISADFDTVWANSWNFSRDGREREFKSSGKGEWSQLETVSQWDPFKDVLKDTWTKWSTYIPDEQTLRAVHSALLRLIQVYRLDLEQLGRSGQIRDHTAADPLSAEDFRNLAITAITEGAYTLASNLTGLVIRKDNSPSLMREVMRLRTVIASVQKYDDEDEEDDDSDDDDDYLALGASMKDLELRLTWKDDTGDENLSWEQSFDTYDPKKGFVVSDQEHILGFGLYNELCRGENIKHDDNLFCEVRYGTLPYYYWWKVEHLKLEPRVTMIYDVISDAETEKLKIAVKPELQRAAVISPFTGEYTITDKRISKHAWLDDQQVDALVKGLTTRMTEATGLDCSRWAEDLQIAVYGIGGLYVPHYDYDRRRFKYGLTKGQEMGDRIATFMIYLSDVPEGGATVFPILRLAVFPVKNAALFWYNIKSDGEPATESLHGGCPVLVGHKWVANKWIHEYGQEFRHPCGLNMVPDIDLEESLKS